MSMSDLVALATAVGAMLGGLASLLDTIRKWRQRKRQGKKDFDEGYSEPRAERNALSTPSTTVRKNATLSRSAWICVGCGLVASVLAVIMIIIRAFTSGGSPGISGLVLFVVISLLFVVGGAVGLDHAWQARHDPNRDLARYDAALGVGAAFFAWISVLIVIS